MANSGLRAGSHVKELTVRGIILGALITVIFTAANVYLGLKLGITFATSIPAAVISMAILRAFRDSTIQENNIVQTIASAAGTLSAIIFVLPGLIMVGWWTGFPYWLSVAVIGIGGILGVLYSVPLRRALVTGTDLPYPEGVAALWTRLRIIGPIVGGIRGALAANRERKAGRAADLPLTERDIPIGIVTGGILVSMIPIGLLLFAFGNTAPIAANPGMTIVLSIIYTLIAGVVIAAVCGYMAGLIGASNSPISGVGILSVLGISLILAALFPHAGGDATKALVAFALFVTAIIFGVATISNNN